MAKVSQKPGRLLTRLAIRTVLAVAVAGGGAALFSLQLGNSYRARVLLIQTPLLLEQKDEVPGMVAAYAEATRRVSFVQTEMPESLPMPDYELLLTSESISTRLRDLLIEKYAGAGIEAGNLTHEKVKRALEVRTKVHLQTVEEIEYQQVIELMLEAKDPNVAAEVANEWAELSIAMAEEMRSVGREDAVALVERQLTEAQSVLETAVAELEALDRQWDVPGLEARLAGLEGAATEAKVRRSKLVSEIARLEAELEQLGAELESISPTLRLEQGPHVSTAQGVQKAASLAMVNEEVNPVYLRIEERRALATAEVAGLKAERSAQGEEMALLEEELARLRPDLAKARGKRLLLDQGVQSHAKNVDELTVSLQSLRLAAADSEPDFKVASAAVPPEEKSAPHRTLIVLVAAFVAATAIPAHFFGMVALRRYVRILEAEEDATTAP